MALSKKQVKDVCMLHGGYKQCRYLDDDTVENDDGSYSTVYLCKKLSPDKQMIDEEVDEFYQDMKKSGQDPKNQGVPLQDNCQGFIVLRTKEQGYDIKV